jgi:hypothetical protein
VLDLYLRDFAAHRIAPYDPAPLDPIEVAFTAGAWEGGSVVTDDPREGRRCLKIADDDARSAVAASGVKRIAVDPAGRYRFSWWVKTARPGQPYLVSLTQHDQDGQWMAYNNIDVLRTGSGAWQREEVIVPSEGVGRIHPKARSVQIVLRPAPWSDAGEATGTAWFDDLHFGLADGGPNLVADAGFESVEREPGVTVDFAAFDRACETYLDGLGFNSITIRLRGMGGGTFHARHPGRIGAFEQGSAQYEALMDSQGRQLVEHLRRKGWLDRAYVYWFDEPDKKDYEFVVDGMERIRRAAPGLTRMLTEQPEPELLGHVDLWCPVVSQYDPKVGEERRRQGDRFWWYLCCGPHAPYIGLFIDHPAVDLRVWAWLSRKWGVGGHLVWQTNYWTSSAAFPPPKVQDPYEDPMSYVSGYSHEAGQIGYWGNGDGRFLYPPGRDPENDKTRYLSGPVGSIRWEMLREGAEDYDTFCLLDELIARARQTGKAAELRAEAEKLAAVPDAVITDDKTYSKDPAALHEHRLKLGGMIERLSRALEP